MTIRDIKINKKQLSFYTNNKSYTYKLDYDLDTVFGDIYSFGPNFTFYTIAGGIIQNIIDFNEFNKEEAKYIIWEAYKYSDYDNKLVEEYFENEL